MWDKYLTIYAMYSIIIIIINMICISDNNPWPRQREVKNLVQRWSFVPKLQLASDSFALYVDLIGIIKLYAPLQTNLRSSNTHSQIHTLKVNARRAVFPELDLDDSERKLQQTQKHH